MSLQQLQGNDIQGRAGPSLLSSAVRMNSILWFITDAPLSRLLRQPPTVFLGAFMSEYTHVMFPPKSGPCITQQPHIGSVPANNPNFHLSNFKVCSIHCNKSQPAPFSSSSLSETIEMADHSLMTTVAGDANGTTLDPVSLVQPHPSS